jgi:hypothetical protein
MSRNLVIPNSACKLATLSFFRQIYMTSRLFCCIHGFQAYKTVGGIFVGLVFCDLSETSL